VLPKPDKLISYRHSNSGTINVDTDSSATVNGNSDVINVGSDGILAAVGGSDTINLTGNIDSLDAVGNSDAISALGSGDTITLQGLSETVTATSDTLDLDAGATGDPCPSGQTRFRKASAIRQWPE